MNSSFGGYFFFVKREIQKMTIFKTYHFLILAFCFLLAPEVEAQIKITGYVTDSSTGETIVGAYITTGSHQVVSTNIYGYYSLVLNHLPDTINYSMIGYQDKQKIILDTDSLKIDVQLVPRQYAIDQVDVIGEKRPIKDQLNAINIPMRRLKVVPNFLGEQDVMKVTSLSPGVTNGKEGTSGLYVRGGTPDQNLILLDGTKMYNSDHLFGYLSVFNPDAIQSFRLYKGDFPTKYGGNLSSIIDVNIKDGNIKEKNKELSVGMISSRLLLEGPIKKDTSSYLLTARLGYWTMVTLPLLYQYIRAKRHAVHPTNFNTFKYDVEYGVYPNYFLYDINAKYSTKLKNKDNFYFSVFAGNDFILLKPFPGDFFYSNVGLRWGTKTFSLQYTHLFDNDIFSDFSLNFSDYNYHLTNEFITTNQQSGSDSNNEDFKRTHVNIAGLQDINFSWNNSYEFSDKYRINFGYSFVHHNQKQGYFGYSKDSILFDKKVETVQNEQNFYLENKVKVTSRLSSKIGLRLPLFFTGDTTYIKPEPRLNLNYQINEYNAVKLSYSHMTQPLHLLTSAARNEGIHNDVWVSSSRIIAPQQSQQLTAGWITRMKKYEIKLETYYKTLENLIDYKEGVNILEVPDSYEDNIVTNGIGKAYGLEFFVNKTQGRLNGWLSYALSWNYRQFNELNLGKWYEHQYSRRHDLSLTATYDLKKNRKLSSTFIFSSGTRATLPSSLYQLPNGSTGAIYTDRNNYIFPSYHRLDVSYTWKKITAKRNREAFWTIGIYNLYAHKNPSYYYFERNYSDPGTNNLSFNIYQKSAITIFPSITYRVKL